MKYKVGDKVKVIGRTFGSDSYKAPYWAFQMTETIGRVYTIIDIGHIYNYHLNTKVVDKTAIENWYYHADSLELYIEVGKQLEFEFMKE